MRPTLPLCAKTRRNWLAMYRHRLMKKVYQNFWGLTPEISTTFDHGRETFLLRLDHTQGEAQSGKLVMTEGDQFDAEVNQNRPFMKSTQEATPMEVYEMGFKVAPGELPFVLVRKYSLYDADKKAWRTLVAPFWGKMLPGDEGLNTNRPHYYAGTGTQDWLEPTPENLMHADNRGERFLPATPEEAAEIEAEEKFERDVRNSMMHAVADLNIVEPPPYYIAGQRTWNSVMPWYKAKAAKGTLTAQEEHSQNWDLLVAWKDDAVPSSPAAPVEESDAKVVEKA
ncbi:hypothetical protein DIPPA_33588 [Diplonema papillatum]|nr:hypothetical protein DIPPA_33588 [Diplonema papillatum]